MLKRKSAGNFSLLKIGHSKLDEVKVEPVDDLLSQMRQANSNAVFELNGQRRESELGNCCRYGCCCEPCRRGMCDDCIIDAMRRMGYSPEEIRERKERDFARHQYDRDRDRNIPVRYQEAALEMAAREWMSRGGYWNLRSNQPIFRSYDDQFLWASIFQGHLARARSEEEAEYTARMRYMNDLRQNETMKFTLDPRDPMGWLALTEKKK